MKQYVVSTEPFQVRLRRARVLAKFAQSLAMGLLLLAVTALALVGLLLQEIGISEFGIGGDGWAVLGFLIGAVVGGLLFWRGAAAIWGTETILFEGERLLVTRKLGPWRRACEIPRSSVIGINRQTNADFRSERADLWGFWIVIECRLPARSVRLGFGYGFDDAAVTGLMELLWSWRNHDRPWRERN
jgi:hypothetical protein